MLPLDDVHLRLRRGDFDNDLVAIVEDNLSTWVRDRDEGRRFKGLYVAAEVFDYFGEYARAETVLQDEGPRALDDLKKIDAGRDPEIVKRQIWLAVAHAVTLYRKEDYRQVRPVLEGCEEALTTLDPGKTSLLGTRARLAHAMGQLERQGHDYLAARACFFDAVLFARRRFLAKTPYAELSTSPRARLSRAKQREFDQHRLLAQWTLGKVLALGLGWIDYITGSLSSAKMLLNSGHALLRETGDTVHRAYTVLLLGTVHRALATSDDELEEAIRLIKDGASGLGSHPAFKWRASYELALALYRSDATRPLAAEEIKGLKSTLKEKKDRRNERWLSAVLVLESRIRRLDKRWNDAVSSADEAVRRARVSGNSETLAEALIAQAEALGERHRFQPGASAAADIEMVLNLFAKALDLAKANPKIAAVAHLHLARQYAAQGALEYAHTEFAAWDRGLNERVEHGFVRKLASDVTKALGREEVFFLDPRAKNFFWKREEHLRNLDAFLLRHADKNQRLTSQIAKDFVRSETWVNRRRHELRKAGRNVDLRRSGPLKRD